MRIETDKIYCGDSLQVLQTLPDNCMDCCVTSPPYYALRDYGTDGQIGREATPEEYVSRITAVFHEVKVGGRMRKRNHVVPVRLNAKELRHLDGQVAKSGLSREEFLRSLILSAQLQTKPCEHHAELLRKIAGLCNNANQLAHVANGTGMAGEASVQEMLRISKETWRLVKEEW